MHKAFYVNKLAVQPGRLSGADTARREAESGDAFVRTGLMKEAMKHFANAARLAPDVAQFHFKLALAALNATRADQVEAPLLKAAQLEPGNPDVRELLAIWCADKGEISQALHHIEFVRRIRPGFTQTVARHADILVSGGQAQQAWAVIAPLIESDVCATELAEVFARLAPMLGLEARAIQYVEQTLEALGSASAADRSKLHLAAAALLDRIGRYEQAFEQARLGNIAAGKAFDRAGFSSAVSRAMSYYTRQRLRSLPRAMHGNQRPVFIVGMPRSGTSLIEQILATHPDVFGAGEMNVIADILVSAPHQRWSSGRDFPECFDFMALQHANEMAGRYLDAIRSRNATARFVTDKMPRNYMMLGMIETLLPECRVIHCVRDARDTCLSCYFTGFTLGNAFAFNLDDLAGVYRDYRRLMAHWLQVLSLPILEVRYEDLIADQEGETRRLLDFLDVPWHGKCLDFHRNRRIVTTASRDQVRRPIYPSSVGRWRHYRKHIPELLGLEP